MKTRIGLALIFTLIVGVCAGWFAGTQWEKKIRKTQSVLAEIAAHDAAQSGDMDKAIEYSAVAFALNNESPTAEIQLKEFIKKRTGQITTLKELKRSAQQ